MLVVNRFRVEPEEAPEFADRLETCRDVLAGQRGYRDGWCGRNVDEPALWTLVTLWRDVGSYRRALSSYEVKVGAVPLLGQAMDEPSAYEVTEPGGPALNEPRPRHLR